MRLAALPALVALGLAPAACGPASRPEPAPVEASPDAYVGGPVEAAGRLEGRITYGGPEVDRLVVVGRDAEACGPLGSEISEGSLLTSEGGGLANAVVVIEGIERGKPVVPSERSLVNARCLFEPRVVVATVGDRLAVGSRDPALHSTRVRLEGRTLFNLTLPEPGSRIVKPLKEPGLLQVGCDAHDWMRAWIWVGSSPYLSLTGADGEFRIDGLPPGPHELLVWHERLGEKRLHVDIPAGGSLRLDLEF